MTQTKIGVGMINATSIGDAKLLQGDGAWVTASAPGLKFISTTDISSAATYDFISGFDASSYDGYGFFLQNVIPATDAVYLWARTSSDATNFDAGGSDYTWHSGPEVDRGSDAADSEIALSGFYGGAGFDVGSTSDESGCSGWVWLISPHLTKQTHVQWSLSVATEAAYAREHSGSGIRLSAADVDGFRLLFSSGSIESGSINAFGIANA